MYKVIFETRKGAKNVLDRMLNVIDAYGFVSIADLYDLIGRRTNWRQEEYGWTNLEDAYITRTYGCYQLNLPPVAEYDNGECVCDEYDCDECECDCEETVVYELDGADLVDTYEALKVFEQHGVPIYKAVEILADLVPILCTYEEE